LLRANKFVADSGGEAGSTAFQLRQRSIVMRAVWFGLVSAVLASSGAQAASSCLETNAVFVAVDHKWAGYDYPITNPSLVGREFRVLKRMAGPVRRTEDLLLRSGGRSYVLRSEWALRTTGTLYTSTTVRPKPRPSIAAKTVSVEDFETQTIFSGPLKGLTLQVKSCP
jgi:hypothetical protein